MNFLEHVAKARSLGTRRHPDAVRSQSSARRPEEPRASFSQKLVPAWSRRKCRPDKRGKAGGIKAADSPEQAQLVPATFSR